MSDERFTWDKVEKMIVDVHGPDIIQRIVDSAVVELNKFLHQEAEKYDPDDGETFFMYLWDIQTWESRDFIDDAARRFKMDLDALIKRHDLDDDDAEEVWDVYYDELRDDIDDHDGLFDGLDV